MDVIATLQQEFDQEMANTRKTLERLPDDKFDWKPHQKSASVAWLGSHISDIPMWMLVTLTTPYLDVEGMKPDPLPTSTADLLAKFDRNVSAAREALQNTSEDALKEIWGMGYGEKKVFEAPRLQVLRGFVYNHLVHHRGQLTVYLRLLDIPVPALYGPSADEGTFGASA